MTLQTVFKRLTDIDGHVQDLIEDTGMKEGYDLGDVIAPNRADPDEMLLFSELSGLTLALCRLHQKLTYLLMPCSDIHVLRKYPNGRYGYDIRPSGDERTFSCGSRLEALVRDEDGCPCWVISRIEHNGSDYYLYGHRGIPLDGLQVRERRRTA